MNFSDINNRLNIINQYRSQYNTAKRFVIKEYSNSTKYYPLNLQLHDNDLKLERYLIVKSRNEDIIRFFISFHDNDNKKWEACIDIGLNSNKVYECTLE